jgi:hypothetical protein
MRHDPTSSEARLFEALRGVRLGVTFRPQAPLLGRYIVDLMRDLPAALASIRDAVERLRRQ